MDLFVNSISVLINQLITGNGAHESPVRLLSRSAIRRMMILTAALAAILTFLVSGLWLILLDLLLTSRQTLSLQFSQVSLVGLALLGLSLFGARALFSRRIWKSRAWQESQSGIPTAEKSPLQQAAAELLRDFVEERRRAREMALQQMMSAEPRIDRSPV